MENNRAYLPLGKYIRLSKEKNTQLLATRHFGLSASEGLVELPLEKGKADKRSYWTLREGQIAIDLMHLGQVREFAFGRYSYNDLGTISNIHTVFDVIDTSLDSKYLSLILKSQKTKNILLHYACHGVEMTLPWEDFCNLPIRVPPPSSQEELVRKYSIVERVIKLKRQINEALEKWMESYYHILFDNLPEEQLERKRLGDLLTIVGGGTPSTMVSEYWTKSGEGIPWIGIRDLTKSKNKFISGGERDITEEGFQNSSTRLVDENTILFSCVGNTIGIMGVCEQSLCFAQSFFGIPVEIKNMGYIWFLLKSNLQEFNRTSLGTTVPNIYKKDLKAFSISTPPKEFVEEFNQVCVPFFQLQKANEREIRELLKLQKYFIELTN